MKKVTKLILISLFMFTLTGCAAIDALRAIGGGSSEKGHGNDNEVVIGGEVNKGIKTGDNIETENGDVNNDKSTNYNADVINIGLKWYELLLILVGLAFVVGWFVKTPKQLKRSYDEKRRKKVEKLHAKFNNVSRDDV